MRVNIISNVDKSEKDLVARAARQSGQNVWYEDLPMPVDPDLPHYDPNHPRIREKFGRIVSTEYDLSKFWAAWREIEKNPESISLELTDREAKTLMVILNKIAGDPKTSLRKYAADIRKKLLKLVPDSEKVSTGISAEWIHRAYLGARRRSNHVSGWNH